MWNSFTTCVVTNAFNVYKTLQVYKATFYKMLKNVTSFYKTKMQNIIKKNFIQPFNSCKIKMWVMTPNKQQDYLHCEKHGKKDNKTINRKIHSGQGFY